MIPEILVPWVIGNRQMAETGVGTSAITILVKPVITFFPGMNLTLLV
jgi:hypothetical protein